MERKRSYLAFGLGTAFSVYAFILFGCLLFQVPAFADVDLLKKHIAAYNLEQHALRMAEATYRGEEGVLGLNPEVAKAFGFKVFLNQDYFKAVELYGQAEGFFERAVEAMSSREKEQYPGEHTKRIEELAILHNEAEAVAWDHMTAYQSKLKVENDERLDRETSFRLLEKLWKEEIEKASYNLRNGLGNFYNRCQDYKEDVSLNLMNIGFVNHVFHAFLKEASPEVVSGFDLDRCENKDGEDSWSMWKYALGNSSSRFALILEEAFEKTPSAKKQVDILLFLALMRQESNFDPRNVSYVGAAGLTQIMPSTAKGLGMKDIFSPPYFKEAGALLGRERKLKSRAKDLLFKVTESNRVEFAKKARGLMQESLDCGKKRKDLYSRYRRELLKDGKDERLNPNKAALYGLRYFSQMMRIQKGDMSLALASYNAGAYRVKQYNGIPPFEETIDFRNKVLKYYRNYQKRAKKNSSKQANK